MRKVISMIIIALGSLLIFQCGGTSSSTPTPPVETPIAIESLDGESDISVTSAFKYTFSEAVTESTVTSDTFFIYPASATTASKIAATISADSTTEYIITPDASLEADTIYVLMVRLTLITSSGAANIADVKAAGDAMGTDDMVIFTTGSDAVPAFVGVLDTTFVSPTGYLTDDAMGVYDGSFNIALDSSDNIYYKEGYNASAGFSIRKYDNEGDVVATFGALGVLDETGSGIDGERMIIDDDVIILVAQVIATNALSVARYNADGTEIASATYNTLNSTPYNVAADTSGNILVVGTTGNNDPTVDMAIWRYTSALSLDATFGTGGVATYNDGGSGSVATSVGLDSSGNIYLGGMETDDDFTTSNILIWKYNVSGDPVTSFGTNGVIDLGVHDGGGVMVLDDAVYALVVEGGGDCSVENQIVKYDTDGNIDTSFGTNGIFDFEGGNAWAGGMTTDGDGNLIISALVCDSPTATTYDLEIWAVDSDTGERVTTAANDGKFIFSDFVLPIPGNIIMNSEERFVVCGADFVGGVGDTDPPFFIMKVR